MDIKRSFLGLLTIIMVSTPCTSIFARGYFYWRRRGRPHYHHRKYHRGVDAFGGALAGVAAASLISAATQKPAADVSGLQKDILTTYKNTEINSNNIKTIEKKMNYIDDYVVNVLKMHEELRERFSNLEKKVSKLEAKIAYLEGKAGK